MYISPSPPADSALPGKFYQAGSLRYTFRGVLILALWLLWGDFAFTFFESVFAPFIPLYLKDLHASNKLIAVMTGSIAGIVNIFFLPNISQASDRFRSRFGRRIPFLAAVTPLAVISLIAIGLVPDIAQWFQSPAWTLPLLCGFVVCYHFFNMVLVNGYTWLLRDVVPLELMARFLGWFRIIGTATSCLFSWLVFPHLMTERRAVFLGAGIFYLVAFLIMCLNVKEGEYPPPPQEKRPGLLKSFALYFRQCLTLPIYRNFFIAWVFIVGATACAQPFSLLFVTQTLNIDMSSLGLIFAWGQALTALIFLPMGWVCDRFDSLRVSIIALSALTVLSLFSALFIHDRGSYVIFYLAGILPGVAWTISSLAASMKLFPERMFGEFSAGLNVFGCGGLIFGNYLMGEFIDLSQNNYRITFYWSAALYALALYPLVLVFRDWKKYGGNVGYRAPEPLETGKALI
jgi:maltose/moltooligosaccharide transporter